MSKYETPPKSYSKNPNIAWEKLKSSQLFTSLNEEKSTDRPFDPTSNTRIVFISDTHGNHREIILPRGTILIHGGDFSRSGEVNTIQDLSLYFKQLMEYKYFEEIVCIAGNHELTFHVDHYDSIYSRFHMSRIDCLTARSTLTNCIYLEDESVKTKGIHIYGSPWQPLFHNWAFNLPRGFPCREKWNLIPPTTDILITHGPPLGRGDEVVGVGKVGCVDLLHEVQERVKPRIHIFGHIHEGYGISSDGTTLFINASSVSHNYMPINPCIVVDVPHDSSNPVVIVTPFSKFTSNEFISWLKNNQLTQSIVHHFQANPMSGNDFLQESCENLSQKLHLNRNETYTLIKAKQLFHAYCFE